MKFPRVLYRCLTCALVVTALGCSSSSRKSIGDTLGKYGYTELRPPSTLVPPGTIVTVIQPSPLVAGIICPANEAFGNEVDQRLATSDSATSKEAQEMTGSFTLDAAYLTQVVGNVNAQSVKNVTVDLANVRVVELPDSAVFALLNSRQRHCAEAITFRKSQGQKVSMVKSVLQADANYRVQFNDNVNASAKAELTKQIAASLGLAGGVKTDDSFSGSKLYWGVRDDPAMAALSATEAPPTGAAADRPRVLPPGANAKIVPLNDNP